MYLKTWYDPLFDAPREPRHIDDRPPPAPVSRVAGLRRRTAAALFELGHLIAPEQRSASMVKAANGPTHHRF